MITKELIERFLRNECTIAERRVVLEHFKQHPEEWEEWLREDDWDRFESLADYDEEYAAKMFERVKGKTLDLRDRRRQRMGWLSAAAVIMLIAGTWWLVNGTRRKVLSTKETSAIAQIAKKGWLHEYNAGAATRVFSLPDGSTVELAPKSAIDYPTDAGDHRLVYLDGKAAFRVAKDKARPFTVYSGDIGTTVLGTYFTVDAFSAASETRIALHEGRVVVRSAEDAKHKMPKDEYLYPGDLLVYKKNTGLATVIHAIKENRLVKATPSDAYSTVNRPDWYQFDGQSLTEVLDQLSAYYQVTIYYYPDQLQNRYFTGRIEQSDSLDNILNDIALLHHLNIQKQKDKSYLIAIKSH